MEIFSKIKPVCYSFVLGVFLGLPASAMTIPIDDVEIDIGVAEVSDFWNALGFDHNWQFVVRQGPQLPGFKIVRSFHLRGFPGDGDDDDDYDDFKVKEPHGPNWVVARTPTQIAWLHKANAPNPLNAPNGEMIFKMDSEFGKAEMLAGLFQVGIDYDGKHPDDPTGEVIWQEGFVMFDNITPLGFCDCNPDPFDPVPSIPLPASLPLLSIGALMFGCVGAGLRRRRRKGATQV